MKDQDVNAFRLTMGTSREITLKVIDGMPLDGPPAKVAQAATQYGIDHLLGAIGVLMILEVPVGIIKTFVESAIEMSDGVLDRGEGKEPN